jgi:hypothetical protein
MNGWSGARATRSHVRDFLAHPLVDLHCRAEGDADRMRVLRRRGVFDMTWAQEIVQRGEWIIPSVLLLVVAWTRFNSPPTNRSGTTFVLFFFGVLFYYALIVALWLLVIISLSQGSIGFDLVGKFLTKASPEAQEELSQYAPIVAALIIVVASQFHQVSRIDTAARAFCVKLAAIPREADRLALELAQSTAFEPRDELRSRVSEIISSINAQAIKFESDGSLASRFTRAVGLYWLFVGSRNDGRLPFPMTAYSKSAYAGIMQLSEPVTARADARYDEMIQTGAAFFTATQPPRELKEVLNSRIREVSGLICGLIARYVLCCELTQSGRLQRLAGMGFDASHAFPRFGRDQWVMTIFAVILLGIIMMAIMPGTLPLPIGTILGITTAFGVSIGFAVIGAIVVAQRFIERHEGEPLPFPPLAELTVAALIVAGLTIALRIAILLVPALIDGGSAVLDNVVTQFVDRLPGVITPAFGTISLGVLCSYLGPLNWRRGRIIALGALGNGLAFALSGLLVGSLIDTKVLEQFYRAPEHAIPLIAAYTGIIGAVVGGIVLAVFNRSERVRKEVTARVAGASAGVREPSTPPPVIDFHAPALQSPSGAAQHLGSYKHADVKQLEGLYVCFRPAFTSAEVINAYLINVHWDEASSCLMFEEQGRIDAGHSQKGSVYIPEGQPFMSLVTVERGAIRMIIVVQPKDAEPGRGLIMTLCNPGAAHFTPASAPIVLKRFSDETPELGFIRPDAAAYADYLRELEAVMPTFGVFAATPKLPQSNESTPIQQTEGVHLSIVR